jgi:orotate phosphoribosyltransferase
MAFQFTLPPVTGRRHSITGVNQRSRVPLAARLYSSAHLTGRFQLRSGISSNEYFDKYLFESDPELLRLVAEALVDLVPPDVDAIAGLELGGVPLATMLSQMCGIPARFVRKEAKSYGTCRLAEGGEIKDKRLAVVEDVITSGGQVVQSCRALRERGADIAGVLCVLDREAGGAENLAAETLVLSSLFSMRELRQAQRDPAWANP